MMWMWIEDNMTVEDAGKWFITTGLFKRGGRIVAGPFPTRKAATADREATENAGGPLNYWIDQAPHTLIRLKKQPQRTELS
jgi:hypothetical protein